MALFLAALAVSILANAQPEPAAAQVPATKPSARDPAAADAAIADRMMAGLQPIRTSRVTLWAEPEALPAEAAQAFAVELEKGLLAIEAMTGEQVDADHYGGLTVHVFVSSRVTISHVYGGYAHPRYDKPYLFLSPQRVKTRTAPYLHELTHIVLWQFGSHSLREGFASHVEGQLAGEGVGYNSGVFGPASRAEVDSAAAAALKTAVGEFVLPWIGRSGATDPAITSAGSEESRSSFYLLARSFVQHLLDSVDLATFIRLYRAEDTEAAYQQLTSRSLDEWRASWQRALARSAAEAGAN